MSESERCNYCGACIDGEYNIFNEKMKAHCPLCCIREYGIDKAKETERLKYMAPQDGLEPPT